MTELPTLPAWAKTLLKAYDKLGGTNLAQVQPRDPDRALQLIETYLRYQLTGNPRFSAAVIIDYGETVAPAGEPGQLPAEDRGAIVTLRRWASEPLFLQRTVTFCVLVETTATLSAALVSDARTFEIAVPVPDEPERFAYLAGRGSRPETFSVVDARLVAILTAGLTRLHLESLLAETEANLERVLSLLDAIGPVAVVVDEADAALGTRETGGADSGVSERVFASLAAFMGDTRRRGKVIWFLMTSRPDLVPVDLKRQGRAEEHLALFPPATVAERVKVFDLLRQRLGITLEPGVDAAALFAESRDALSAADLEAILVRSSRRMASGDQKALSAGLLRELIRDFQPPSYPLELEYQRLIAAFECTSRQLLPPDLAAVPPEAIGHRLTELRAALGKSA